MAQLCHYNDTDCVGVVNEFWARLGTRIALCQFHAVCTVCMIPIAERPATHIEAASFRGRNGVWAYGGAHAACCYWCPHHQSVFPRAAVCSHFYHGPSPP